MLVVLFDSGLVLSFWRLCKYPSVIKPILGLGGISVVFPDIPIIYWCVTVIPNMSTSTDTSSTNRDTSSSSDDTSSHWNISSTNRDTRSSSDDTSSDLNTSSTSRDTSNPTSTSNDTNSCSSRILSNHNFYCLNHIQGLEDVRLRKEFDMWQQ